MEISRAYNPTFLSLTNLVRARYSSGKIAVPVQRSQLVYSHLKHVCGVPAVRHDAGYPLTLLRRLDNLIDNLIGVKGQRPHGRDVSGLSEQEISSLVHRYEADLHTAATGASQAFNVQVQGVLLDTFA